MLCCSRLGTYNMSLSFYLFYMVGMYVCIVVHTNVQKYSTYHNMCVCVLYGNVAMYQKILTYLQFC